MINVSYAVRKWDSGRSLEGLSLVLGIEAALITALLALRTYAAVQGEKIQADKNAHQVDNPDNE